MLSARDVIVTRRGSLLLDGVSLSIRSGEFVALIGQNGAGKSTLLHVLSGALQPDHGVVSLAGRPLHAWPRTALARSRAVLPQSSDIAFPFTLRDMVLMGRSAHAGVTTDAANRAIADAALAAADLGACADRLYPSLSGGERQRAQLARVIAQIWSIPTSDSPRFLLLDEPTNHLDLAHQLQILRIAQRLAQDGIGVLAILHDPNLAAIFAGRVAVLKAGRLLADGPTDRILCEEILENALGLPVIVQRHPTLGHPLILPRG